MLDARFITENRDLVLKAIRNKGEKKADVEAICTMYGSRKSRQQEIDDLRSQVNRFSKEYGESKKKGNPDESLLEKSKEAGGKIKTREAEQREDDAKLKELLAWVPNIPDGDVPVGEDAGGNKIVREWGEKRQFPFPPKAHWDIASALDLVDFERAPKVSGANFLLMRGRGALLERALINFMLDLHTREHGYTEISPPYLSSRSAMFGSAQIPKLEGDMYHFPEDDLFLIPTAEVPLTNMHSGEILPHAEVPTCYTAYSACFRREAGAHGRETRGMIRVHQFDKVELLKLANPDDSADELESLLGNAETVLQKLGLPYRVVFLCTGDMSFASAKTYDIEVWAPGIERWLEVSSCSNFTDFQARRAGLRFRGEDKKVRFLHTLNGSGLALPRTVIGILENGQREDGSVVIPEPLRPYLGGLELLTK